jgi:hypothetical protein
MRMLLGLAVTQPSCANDGAIESMLTIACLGATTDRQGPTVDHPSAIDDHHGATIDRLGVAGDCQGATIDRMGAAVDHSGAVDDHQGATIDRPSATSDRQGAAVDCLSSAIDHQGIDRGGHQSHRMELHAFPTVGANCHAL